MRGILGRPITRTRALLIAGGLAVCIAAFDAATPKEIHVQAYYGLPVAICVWSSGVLDGAVLALISIIVSVLLFLQQGGRYSSWIELTWEGFTRVAGFACLIWLIHRLRQSYESELRAHAALESDLRIRRELTAMLSHELGNAASVIELSLSYLRRASPRPRSASATTRFLGPRRCSARPAGTSSTRRPSPSAGSRSTRPASRSVP